MLDRNNDGVVAWMYSTTEALEHAVPQSSKERSAIATTLDISQVVI